MPKRYNTPHRSHVVKTRLTDEEYADFTERLAPYGISQSEFLRQAIRRTAIRPVIHVSAVNDELLSAVGKLTAEYAVLEGVVSAGSDAVLLRMNETPNSTAVADLFEAGGMIIGSSTLNSGMLPTMGSLLVYLKGLNPTGKKAAVFGTYGWAGGAQKDMEALLTAAGFELEPGFTCKWKAQPEDLEAARQLGYEFARKLQK